MEQPLPSSLGIRLFFVTHVFLMLHSVECTGRVKKGASQCGTRIKHRVSLFHGRSRRLSVSSAIRRKNLFRDVSPFIPCFRFVCLLQFAMSSDQNPLESMCLYRCFSSIWVWLKFVVFVGSGTRVKRSSFEIVHPANKTCCLLGLQTDVTTRD